jgi:hypothetical protein
MVRSVGGWFQFLVNSDGTASTDTLNGKRKTCPRLRPLLRQHLQLTQFDDSILLINQIANNQTNLCICGAVGVTDIMAPSTASAERHKPDH